MSSNFANAGNSEIVINSDDDTSTRPPNVNTNKSARGGRGGIRSNVTRGGKQKFNTSGKRDKPTPMPNISADDGESTPPEYLNSHEAANIHKKQTAERSNEAIGNSVNNRSAYESRGFGNGKTKTGTANASGGTISSTTTTTIAGTKPRAGTETEMDQDEEEEGSEKGDDDNIVGSPSDTSEVEFEYIGSDLQMLKRTKPRRLEGDIIGLPHNGNIHNNNNNSQIQENAGIGGKTKKPSVVSAKKDNIQWSQAMVITNEEDGMESENDDDLFNEAYDNSTQQMGDKKESTKPPPAKKKKAIRDDNITAAGRKYVGLTEFERGVPKIDTFGRSSTLTPGNSKLFDIPFEKRDMLDGPPFPLTPSNGVIIWLCRTCRDISQRTKGKSYNNGRVIFTIDLCRPCRILNIEVRDCFEDQERLYGTMTRNDIKPAHKKFPYPGQYTKLASAPFTLARTEVLAIVMCEYCRLLTSNRQCTRDVNGRCRLTINLCQKCADVNSEISMSLHPTQAELNRSKSKRDYFAADNETGASGSKAMIHTHGKCVRD